MNYIIKEPYALRGWEGIPYALADYRKGRMVRIGKYVYDVLSLCGGTVDFDNFLIPDTFRECAEKLAEEGVIEPCGSGRALRPYQNYKLYPNKYIEAAHWSITGNCNYNCRHCYMSAPEAKYGELDRRQCLDIIEQFHDCGGGCRASALYSGSGLMGPDKTVCKLYHGGYIPRVMEAARGHECLNWK